MGLVVVSNTTSYRQDTLESYHKNVLVCLSSVQIEQYLQVCILNFMLRIVIKIVPSAFAHSFMEQGQENEGCSILQILYPSQSST